MKLRTIFVALLPFIICATMVACDDVVYIKEVYDSEMYSEETSFDEEIVLSQNSPMETESATTYSQQDESDNKDTSSKVTLGDIFSGLFEKCEHEEIIKIYSFQPHNSFTMNYMRKECKNCNQVFYKNMFYNTPSDWSYLDAMNNGEHFIEGEYYTVTAEVVYNFDPHDRVVKCKIEKDEVYVFFSIEFTEEYLEESALLEVGEIFTFRGKAPTDGKMYWTDCELFLE